MNRAMSIIERAVVYALMALMAIVLVLATFDLIWAMALAVATPPYFIVALDSLLEIFSMFLLVLVGLELLDTITAYIQEHVVHAEIVLLAAMIAVARKAITLDFKRIDPIAVFGIAALLLGLAIAYFLLKRANVPPEPPC